MKMKQVSLTIPKNLFKFSKKYSDNLGYKNIQEYILELLRRKVFYDKIDRDLENNPEVVAAVEQSMEEHKEGKGKTFKTAKELKDYIEGLG